jgi:neopullulanase
VARHVEPDFWADFRRACKAAKPDCYLLAEVWGNSASWLQGDQFDATMNYIFRDLCVAYFARAEIDTTAFLDGLTRMLGIYAPQVTNVNCNLLSSHDVERFRHAAGERPERLALATLLQMTVPGAAAVYYGDEIGLTGGDDPDCRRAFPWDRPDSWDKSELQTVRKLAALRHTYPALRHGDWRLIWTGREAFAFERVYEGRSVLVVINRGGMLDALKLPVASAAPSVLWGQATVTPAGGGLVLEAVPAWSGVVVAL